MKWLLISVAISIPTTWQKSVKMKYQAPEIEWQEPKNNEVIYDNNYQNNVICFWHNPINSYFIRKNPDEKSPKPFVVAYGGRELKEMASVADAKEWVEQIHYPSALRKAGFKPVDKEVLKPTVYRLDYMDAPTQTPKRGAR